MPDFLIRVLVRDVAEGDVTDVAQQIYNTHGEALDAAQGDFAVTISKVEGGGAGGAFPVDWTPEA